MAKADGSESDATSTSAAVEKWLRAFTQSGDLDAVTIGQLRAEAQNVGLAEDHAGFGVVLARLAMTGR